MISVLPSVPALLNVARRVVWFRAPDEALADPVHFLAHVMTFGTSEDLRALSGFVDETDFAEVLDRAPPGLFDERSWAYWNLKLGRAADRPMPVRLFPEESCAA